MFRSRAFWITGLIGLFLSPYAPVSASPATFPAHSVRGSITRSGEAVKGTPEYESILQFLVQTTADNQHESLVDRRSTPQEFSVSLTSHFSTSGAIPAAPIVGGDPPVPLPGGTHNSGDTFSVTACGGGTTETWVYVWESDNGGGWILQSYSYARTTSCQKPGN